jgi:CopG family nickel-responsive transcriptional regulator
VDGLTVVSLSIPEKLLERIDESVEEHGFASRSEIVRQALRFFLREDAIFQRLKGKVVATITVIYERSTNREKISEIQHEYGEIVSTFLHSHLSEEYCLEVLVVSGDARSIQKLVDAFKTNEEIRQIKIVVLNQS